MKAIRSRLGQFCSCRARRGADDDRGNRRGDASASQSPEVDLELLVDGGNSSCSSPSSPSCRQQGSTFALASGSAPAATARAPAPAHARAAQGDGQKCVMCRRGVPRGACAADTTRSYCKVAVPSIFDGLGGQPRCLHGPFCGRCRRRMEVLTLSTCVCRAVVQSWY
eukprot:TRINITY_DN56365_c0_g1_i1.p2 TRINITY_DN56365_c0_g1~~TRINITY_DN56365_c0_g1_i1.p2  ORF type:complete len:167 (-),score=19.43 TRINITY_DN56365_c0_g1_i1:100-600(-)